MKLSKSLTFLMRSLGFLSGVMISCLFDLHWDSERIFQVDVGHIKRINEGIISDMEMV